MSKYVVWLTIDGERETGVTVGENTLAAALFGVEVEAVSRDEIRDGSVGRGKVVANLALPLIPHVS